MMHFKVAESPFDVELIQTIDTIMIIIIKEGVKKKIEDSVMSGYSFQTVGFKMNAAYEV